MFAILRNILRRNAPLTDGPWWSDWMGGGKTQTGLTLSDDDMISGTTLFLALRILSEDLAKLPLVLFEKTDQSGHPVRTRARDHHVYDLLKTSPNPEQTSFEFREMLQGQLLWHWRAYVNTVRDRRGRVKEMWPLDTRKMINVTGVGDGRIYWYQPDVANPPKPLGPDEVMPLTGWHTDGHSGPGPLQRNREAVSLGVALEQFAAKYFGQGINQGGLISIPGKLKNKEAIAEFKKSINVAYGGLDESHRVMVLEEGSTWTPHVVDPRKSQSLESRKFHVIEAARMYRIPPHMLMDLERATFSNIEQQAIDYVTNALMPWLVRWEQRLDKALLTDTERKTHGVEFLVAGLLRGDIKTRYEVYQIAKQNGIMTANEIREKENMNPRDGGDKLEPAANIGGNQATPPEPEPEPEDKAAPPMEIRSPNGQALLAIRKRFEQLILDAAQRLIKREVRQVRAAAQKFLKTRDTADMVVWLEEFYEDFPGEYRKLMAGPMRAFTDTVGNAVGGTLDPPFNDTSEAFFAKYLESVSETHAAFSKNQLRKILSEASESEKLAILESRLDEWVEKRASKIAGRELVQAEGAAIRNIFRSNGVTKIIWRTNGENCPFCDELDGQTVGIDSNFAEKGDSIGNEDDPRVEHVYRAPVNVMHPPLHVGCDCHIENA